MDDDSSPFHAGERAVQQRLGVRERVERGGRRMLRDQLPDEHREFFERLPFLVVGSTDRAARPWASLLSGEAGFVTSPHPRSLLVASTPALGDPLLENLRAGAPLGVLGIELETRRRNRANGRVLWCSERGFELGVEQAFGNCRMYIQARTRGEPRLSGAPAAPAPGGPLLGARAVQLLGRTDTLFLATSSANATLGGREGVDVSHRGGLPGGLRVDHGHGRTRVTLPDYAGNNMFNSLGNIEVHPRAGLLACDFASGDLLSLTGAARVLWDSPDLARFPGAERLLALEIEAHVLLPHALSHTWSAPEYSPQLSFVPRSAQPRIVP
jgi:predicted pyridoxine 5'-phosphate oxidase superfamily flavin-nucleotide-binding protein